MKPYSIPSSIGYNALRVLPWNGGGTPIYTMREDNKLIMMIH